MSELRSDNEIAAFIVLVHLCSLWCWGMFHPRKQQSNLVHCRCHFCSEQDPPFLSSPQTTPAPGWTNIKMLFRIPIPQSSTPIAVLSPSDWQLLLHIAVSFCALSEVGVNSAWQGLLRSEKQPFPKQVNKLPRFSFQPKNQSLQISSQLLDSAPLKNT